ncbi:MAG: PCP reductase family protein, partial [Candidatus Dormiibacterota bacterium]
MSQPEPSGCPFPGPDNSASKPDEQGVAEACPVPASARPPDVAWDVEAHVAAMRKARAAAETSHVTTDKAEEMARKATEQRAERRGLDQINADFVDSLSKKLGYGHPLSN